MQRCLRHTSCLSLIENTGTVFCGYYRPRQAIKTLLAIHQQNCSRFHLVDISPSDYLFCVTAVGAALGLRFKVFVLVPAIAVVTLPALLSVLDAVTAFGPVCLALSVVTALQIGYIAGTFLIFGVMGAQAPNSAEYRGPSRQDPVLISNRI